MMILTLWGLLLIVTVTMQQDITYFSGVSGVFQSPGYPDTIAPVWAQWNITVAEDRRIRLHFLDFELHESNPCILDSFVLYDGTFESELGKFCWDSYNELNPSTYISSGRSFLLSLRTHGFYTRKGFRANYSSIPKESTSTAAPSVTTTKATITITKVTTKPPDILSSTTSTIKLSQKPSVTVVASIHPAITPGVIAASVIVLILVILCVAITMWKSKTCKRVVSSHRADRSQTSPTGPTPSNAAYVNDERKNGPMYSHYYENQREAQRNRAFQQSSNIHQDTSPQNQNGDTPYDMYEPQPYHMYL